MKKTGKERDKIQIATTTIIISIVVVALYFVSRYAGKNLFGTDITDSSAIFLSLIPFVIYLVVSGRITEFRGGGFEVKFKEAAGGRVLFEQQPVEYEEARPEEKGGPSDLRKITAQAAEDHSTILGLRANSRYSPSMLREYLEELSRFEHAKYVVFSDRNRRFQGFVPMRDLLTSLKDERESEMIIDTISRGDLDHIPRFRRDFIQDAVSNKEALNILENRKITDIAVIDANGRFRGFTNKNTIMLSIVKNLLSKI